MGSGGSVGTTSATIQGTNSNAPLVDISIVSPVAPILTIVSPSQAERVIPVNTSYLDILVQNGASATENTTVTATLPSAWANAVTVSYIGCTNVAPGGTCTLRLTATAPFIAGQITINGTHGANTLTTYTAFRVGGGLVFSVSGATTKVVIDSDLTTVWGAPGYAVGGN